MSLPDASCRCSPLPSAASPSLALRWRRLLGKTLRRWDDAVHRRLRGTCRRVVFDGETFMHFSVYQTLIGALRHDPRLTCCLTSSWPGGLKASVGRVCQMLAVPSEAWIPFRRAQWVKWDLYISSCFDRPALKRSTPWLDVFHGVGEKWVENGRRLYMCHPLAVYYDRLLCPNVRLANQFRAHPEFLKMPHSLRVTGYPPSDLLVWFGSPDIQSRLKEALGFRPQDRVALLAPTWGPDGLLERFAESVLRLCQSRNVRVVVKLHACSYLADPRFNGGRAWQAQMDAWAVAYGALHLPHAHLPALMLAADLMIADFGSAPVEFCLLGRPLIFFALLAQAERTAGDRTQFDLLTQAGGKIQSLDQFAQVLDKAPGSDCLEQAQARRAVVDMFFHAPGEATEQALREIYALLEVTMPEGLVAAYRHSQEQRILQHPRQWLGLEPGYLVRPGPTRHSQPQGTEPNPPEAPYILGVAPRVARSCNPSPTYPEDVRNPPCRRLA